MHISPINFYSNIANTAIINNSINTSFKRMPEVRYTENELKAFQHTEEKPSWHLSWINEQLTKDSKGRLPLHNYFRQGDLQKIMDLNLNLLEQPAILKTLYSTPDNSDKMPTDYLLKKDFKDFKEILKISLPRNVYTFVESILTASKIND